MQKRNRKQLPVQSPDEAAEQALLQIAAASAQPADDDDADDIEINSIASNVRKRTQKGIGTWIQSPFTLMCFSAVDPELTDLARERKLFVSPVIKIRAAYSRQKNRVYLYPTDKDDPDGFLVNRTDGRMWINIHNFMAQMDVLIEVGKQKLFNMVRTTTAKTGPVLMIDLNKALDTKSMNNSGAKASAKRAAAKKTAKAATEKEAATPKQQAAPTEATPPAAPTEPPAPTATPAPAPKAADKP